MKLLRKGRLKQGIGACVGILLLVAIPVGITWRELYLDKLNHRLLSAVKANNINLVIDLLARGADANTHDDPLRKVSLWQRLQEALHFKQKPRSSAPSALCLALEWRPVADSAITPTIEDTPLIRALMSHGARLAAPEIVARMQRTYAFCFSYQDAGSLSMTDASENLSFRTAFVRPKRLYFEYLDFEYPKVPQHYILWENSSGVHSWMTHRSGGEEEESLRMAIAGANGLSLGATALVPPLLVPEQMNGVGGMLSDYPDARLVGIKTVDGVACYEIVPTDTRSKIISVDMKTFLIQKVVRSYPAAGDTVTLYHPQVNVPISARTFQVHPPQ